MRNTFLVAACIALPLVGAARQQAPIAPASAPAAKGIWTIPADANFWGPVSPDGRYVAYGSEVDGEIYVRDLIDGANRRLTFGATPGGPDGEPVQAFGDDLVTFSPDGSQLAFGWRTGTFESLRVIDLRGTGQQRPRVLVADPDAQFAQPSGWSPDGLAVAYSIAFRNHPGYALGIVSTQDAKTQIIHKTTDDEDQLRNAYFSPDGRFIVYERSQGDTPARELTIVTRDGFKTVIGSIKIVGGLINWTAAGLVLSQLEGATMSLVVRPVDVNARTVGDPQVLVRGLSADIDQMGVTTNGAFYYRLLAVPSWQSSIARIDFATGEVTGGLTTVAPPAGGKNAFPASWSRDGSRSVFVVQASAGGRSLYVRESETGDLHRIDTQLSSFQAAELSPDGRSIGLVGADKQRRRGIFQVDAMSGAVTLLTDKGDLFRTWSADGNKVIFDRIVDDGTGDVVTVERTIASGGERIIHRGSGRWMARLGRVLSKDGTRLYYLRPELGATQELVAKDVASGEETVLVGARAFGPLSISTGGQYIAATVDSVFSVIPTTGGLPKPVSRLGGQISTILSWAADGRSFLGRGPSTGDLWWVPVDGRAAHRLSLVLDSTAMITSASNGSIAIVQRAGPRYPSAVLFALDNVLKADGRLP